MNERRRCNLLADPTFAVSQEGGDQVRLTLPGVLAALSSGTSIEFLGVRPYQEQAWYCFLVQLAAFAQDRVSEPRLWSDEQTWTKALRALTDADDDPWTLVVPDLSRPAFLQPPVPENELSVLKNGPITEPDDVALDVLFTARAHDIKPRRVVQPAHESWVHALLLLQTLSGFGGKSNYGIARMNGAYSSRPLVGISGPWAERFRRDVPLWSDLGTHESMFDRKNGIGLTWIEPWSGDDVLVNAQLHPAHIEICRRIRLVETDQIAAFRSGTKVPRTDKSERGQLKGNLGCIWTPVLRAKGTPLTLKGGFTYRQVQSILFSGEWDLPASLSLLSTTSAAVEFRALEGGQGETAGFHLRHVPVPQSARRRRSEDWVQIFGERSRAQLALVDAVNSKVLRLAIAVLLQGDPEKPNFKDDRIRRALTVFDRLVDQSFFPSLFRDPDAYAEDHTHWWSVELRSHARRVLREAQAALPIPDSRRERALAASDAIFFAGIKKHLPALAGGNNGEPT